MPIKITCKKLILVEGSSDKAFFEKLLENRNIEGFNVFSPWDMGTKLEGEDSIKHLLDTLPIQRGFDAIERILVVVDSDTDPVEKFNKFKKLLSETKVLSGRTGRYPEPITPNIFESSGNGLSVAIMTLPCSSSTGAMETLCLQAAMPQFPAAANCIDAFVTCAGADLWSPQKLAKFRLRSLISTQHDKNPDLPTTYLWDCAPNIVPLSSAAFDVLADFLNNI